MDLTPKQIVCELDKYIIGQDQAKKAVAVALRNRYRRSQLTKEQMEEFIFLGLRKMKGISLEEFKATFGKEIRECYGDKISEMIARGFLEEKGGNLCLTRSGIDVSNQVFAEILN